MDCNFCEKNGVLCVCDAEDLLIEVTDLAQDLDLDCISIIADEDTAKEVLYYAINDDIYNIESIDLDRYGYNDAYIITINNHDSCYGLNIDKALGEKGVYLATDTITFIQFDLPCKCQYIEDVMNNKYIKEFDPQFFIFGSFNEEEYNKPEDDKCRDNCEGCENCGEGENHYYTYANDYHGNNGYSEIFVSSTDKVFVSTIKDFFEHIFK